MPDLECSGFERDRQRLSIPSRDVLDKLIGTPNVKVMSVLDGDAVQRPSTLVRNHTAIHGWWMKSRSPFHALATCFFFPRCPPIMHIPNSGYPRSVCASPAQPSPAQPAGCVSRKPKRAPHTHIGAEAAPHIILTCHRSAVVMLATKTDKTGDITPWAACGWHATGGVCC